MKKKESLILHATHVVIYCSSTFVKQLKNCHIEWVQDATNKKKKLQNTGLKDTQLKINAIYVGDNTKLLFENDEEGKHNNWSEIKSVQIILILYCFMTFTSSSKFQVEDYYKQLDIEKPFIQIKHNICSLTGLTLLCRWLDCSRFDNVHELGLQNKQIQIKAIASKLQSAYT